MSCPLPPLLLLPFFLAVPSYPLMPSKQHRVKAPGSCTALVAVLRGNGVLDVTVVGDCGLRLVRDGEVVLATEVRGGVWESGLGRCVCVGGWRLSGLRLVGHGPSPITPPPTSERSTNPVDASNRGRGWGVREGGAEWGQGV